jgi:putative membrane protein
MSVVAKILVGLVALIHLYIAWFEMFAWTSRGPKVFATFPAELFAQTTTMASNQGLYNGFLAAGLLWSLLISEAKWQRNVALFFLVCVAIAGVYGAITASLVTLYAQLIPATLAIIALLLSKRKVHSN